MAAKVCTPENGQTSRYSSGDFFKHSGTTFLFRILGPLCHLSVPSMICSNFYRPRNKNCYLYLPNVNYLTETVLSCSGLLRGSDSARGLLHLPKRPEHLSSDPLACYLLHGGAKIVMMRRRIKIPICCICVSHIFLNLPLTHSSSQMNLFSFLRLI